MLLNHFFLVNQTYSESFEKHQCDQGCPIPEQMTILVNHKNTAQPRKTGCWMNYSFELILFGESKHILHPVKSGSLNE